MMNETRRFQITIGYFNIPVILLLMICSFPAYSHEQSESAKLKQILDEMKILRLELAKVSQAVTELHREQIAPVVERPGAVIDTDIELSDLQHVFGNPDASVVMLEFSEFQCPYCARFNKQTLSAIKRDYIDTGKLAFAPMDFPLDFHDKAKSAAIFSQCAIEQKKYWEVREALYQNQRNLGDEAYTKIATELNLDLDAVRKCQHQIEIVNAVDSSVKLGGTMGVSGTPTIFIGKMVDGKIVDVNRIVGAQPENVVRKIIDSKI